MHMHTAASTGIYCKKNIKNWYLPIKSDAEVTNASHSLLLNAMYFPVAPQRKLSIKYKRNAFFSCTALFEHAMVLRGYYTMAWFQETTIPSRTNIE